MDGLPNCFSTAPLQRESSGSGLVDGQEARPGVALGIAAIAGTSLGFGPMGLAMAPGQLDRSPQPEQQAAGGSQLPQAPAQHHARQRLGWWLEQLAAEGDLGVDLFQTRKQQPGAEPQGPV